MRWLEGESGYTTLEPSADPTGGRDIVRHDPKTAATDILVSRRAPRTARAHGPLGLDDYSFSADRSRLLIFTNSKRVWRTNTRGDYWVLDRTSHELYKLGGDAPPASLMHAKFSPDGSRVAFVRSNNIYVEDLHDHRIVRLTTSNSPDLINGTFDWVYEEEFGLRDGFRWSPDGNSIAYWQLDTTGVREFPLVNNTDSLYPRINPIKYPKVGETNAACRVGVVATGGGETRWMKIAGDPRNHYVAFMEWAGDSEKIVLQQFNRHQNTRQRLAGGRPHRPGRHDADRSRRRLDRSTGRDSLDSRQPGFPLAERTRRLAASLQGLASRWQTLAHHGRRFRRDRAGRQSIPSWIGSTSSPLQASQLSAFSSAYTLMAPPRSV